MRNRLDICPAACYNKQKCRRKPAKGSQEPAFSRGGKPLKKEVYHEGAQSPAGDVRPFLFWREPARTKTICNEENKMACFLVPTAEAIVTTLVAKSIKKNEKKAAGVSVDLGGGKPEKATRLSFVKKL